MQVKKIYKHYQKYAKASHKFCFKLQNNVNFNYTIYVNIMQFKKQDMLYIINKIINFKAMQLIRKKANLATVKAIFNAFKLA